MTTIVGRKPELDAIRTLVETSDSSPRALVIDGEAGIGKTTLWRHALDTARATGIVTLVSAPGENDASLPYAALADLLDHVSRRALSELPESQAAVLAAAARPGLGADGADEHAVARATLSLIRTVAVRPLLVAVDDAQWLDAPSARVIEFVVRRLGEMPVRVLISRRTTHDEPPPLGLARALRAEALQLLRVDPLTTTDLDDLLRSRLGLRLPRPALVRLEQITRGNPYYALEIAHSVAAGGELEVPRSLTEALELRISGLPPAAQQALLLAAASLRPSLELVERAGGNSDGLRTALEQGFLVTSAGRLQFTHPLLASAAYERTLPSERAEVHRRLADASAAGSDERAVHLARGHAAADASVAEELEGTAGSAAARGAPGLAAELAEAAARLTPVADEAARKRRLVSASEYHEAAGDAARGRQLLEALIRDLDPGPVRAALLIRLSEMLEDAPMDELFRISDQALAEARGDASLTAEIHTSLASFNLIAGDPQRSLRHARAAVQHARDARDEKQLAIAIGEACYVEAMLALRWNREAMAEALEIEQRVGGLPNWARPSVQLAVISTITDELDVARRLLTAELRRAQQAGDEPGVFYALFRLAEVELRAGSWPAALRTAREAFSLARQVGIDVEEAMAAAALASILAHVGELEEARALAQGASDVAARRTHRGIAARSAGVLGFVELQEGDPERALSWLTPARQQLQQVGTGELSISGVVQSEIEALVAVGRLDEADDVSAWVARMGEPAGRAWHRAVADRGRALVASARGDVAAARLAIEAALRAHESLPQPFERARSLLAAGLVERRARAWGPARAALSQALELFDVLGASRFSERAAAELARLPGRRPRSTELTDTERRVAELAAEGLANKEIAGRLFVSVRTVEANLSRVYAKLGVRSRTELARRILS